MMTPSQILIAVNVLEQDMVYFWNGNNLDRKKFTGAPRRKLQQLGISERHRQIHCPYHQCMQMKARDPDLEDRLIRVLGRNMSMLNSQLEAQNINCQLDREQRNDHNDSLARALSTASTSLAR
ncbi:hypothetical protein OIU76_022446 [Salix suchowensis]|nr:hypothetical protein OIU76_022446 [Salix suchowensis]